MKPVRILIADDHEVMRYGVRAIVESQPSWEVCGEASTGREAVAKAIELQPDVVALDISMPDLNGLEATRQIRRLSPAKILILTIHESEQIATEVIDAGAQGYVLKADAGRTLVDAIRILLAGQEFFTERVQALAEGRSERRHADRAITRRSRLSPREREVLHLLAEGKSNKEIASALGIATGTTETHRARVMSKLNLHSMSELVRYAIRNRIIEP
jgi:DNA-binding NarL/FixJ family response regulator